MPTRAALIVVFALGLTGCSGGSATAPRAYPALVPINQILNVPRPKRRPIPGLEARGEALAARAAELMAN